MPEPSFSRFRGRYRLAASFQSASFSHLAANTQAGYSSLLRLALSYAALESLCSAMQLQLNAQVVDDGELADRLRSRRGERLAAVMRADVDAPLSRRLNHLLDNPEATNVLAAAAFYRHKFLHGHLTASRAGAGRSSWERAVVDDLAGLLLVAADDRFTAHVAAPIAG
jgi:hypothetical protein